MQIDLPAAEVYDILVNKDVKGLYHANTVRTSKTYLQEYALLSRKHVQDKRLVQTDQKSDAIDKKYEIYDHIFVDAINISKYFYTYNKYGPILFGLKTDLLKSPSVPTVRITKKNPIYWKDEDTVEDKYYTSVDDFKLHFKSGNKLRDGGNHITLTTVNGRLPLNDFIFGIQIDDPGLTYTDENGKSKSIYEGIVDFYSEDLSKNNLPMEKIFRKDNSFLKVQYSILNKFYKDDFKRLFSRKGPGE
jgi:hypothetical protein